MINSKTENPAYTLLVHLFLFIVFIVTVFPVFYAFLASFKTNQEIMTSGIRIFPEKFIFDNYIQAWSMVDFKTYTFNSLYMTFFVVVGTLAASTVGGYVFERGNFPGKNFIFNTFTATMFVCMGSITIYPLLDIAKLFNIHKSLWGIIIIKIFGLHIVNLFLVKSFVKTIPIEIDEAATIDGCGFTRIFVSIVAPLLKPVIATIGIITFKDAWNDYLLPMVFTMANPKQAPLVVGIVSLKSTGEGAGSWNLMMAGSMISIIPMLFMYLFFNRYFIEGLSSGAVKG